jgi:hypothetical protein
LGGDADAVIASEAKQSSAGAKRNRRSFARKYSPSSPNFKRRHLGEAGLLRFARNDEPWVKLRIPA